MCVILSEYFIFAEFTGWHGRYDDEAGENLLREMLANDVNHPCIFMWSNGNEGGWNKTLDTRFADYDPQKRHVIHPWADFNGLDTHHYPAYQTGPARLANGYNVFMPTESCMPSMIRELVQAWKITGITINRIRCLRVVLYGHLLMKQSCVQTKEAFWILTDRMVRTVLLGPHREKEGSFYTIREVWRPIQFAPLHITPSFKGDFLVIILICLLTWMNVA